MIVGLIIITLVFVLWTKFNYSESKSINERWEKLLQAEENKENTFKRINSVTVCTKERGNAIYTEARSFMWDNGNQTFYLYNDEQNVIAIYPICEIDDVKINRNAEPTNV